MHILVALLIIALPVVFYGGWYCHWRFGSQVKAEVQQVKVAVQNFVDKASGK